MEKKKMIIDGKEYLTRPLEIYQIKKLTPGATKLSFDFSVPKSQKTADFLHELDESELTLKFIRESHNTSTFFSSLGVDPFNCWIFHETLTQKIVPDFKYTKPGDVDLIIGNFHDDGRTPDFNYIVGVEIKIRKFVGHQLKSFSAGTGTEQTRNLAKIGFDKTYLFHFFTMEPTPVKEGYSESWNPIQNTDFSRLASASAKMTMNKMRDESFGYGYLGWGQAHNASSSELGGISQEILIQAPFRPFKHNLEAQENREYMTRLLGQYISENYTERKPLIIKK